MKDIFDRLAASSPLNTTAARVVSGGENYDPKINFANHWHSDCPPKMRRIPEISLQTCGDLIGKKFGRLTVIGLADDYNPKQPARWVVRCACGDYEHRSARAIRNPKNDQDRCLKCKHLRRVQWKYDNLGSRSIDEIIGAAPASE